MLNGAAPAFDVEGGWVLVLVRTLWVAALLSAFGSALFRAFVAPPALRLLPGDDARRIGGQLDRITRLSLLAAMIAGLAWLVLTAANMASADSFAQAMNAVPTVLTGTAFGHVIVAQLGVLVLAVLILGRGRSPARCWMARCWMARCWMARCWMARCWMALAACAAATALQAGHGHAASMYEGPSWLLVADVLHLSGAGGWLGGLIPLLLIVCVAPVNPAVTAARYFSPLGQICIAAVAGSALFQAWVMIGSIPGLVGTAYGWVALGKLALLAVLLGFAAVNRYRFAPALVRGEPGAARLVLIRSIVLQTGFSLAVLAVAAVLTSMAPAMHLQAVWPFTAQFSLSPIQEDPALERDVILASLALAGAAALLVLAVLLRRRISVLAVLGAGILAWLAAPLLDPLFVAAYPTSFYHSPTGFAATSIAQGAALFPDHCAACHGAHGQGDGPAAAGLPVPPPDLTAAALWEHGDGELFWWLTHGIDAPEGGLAMPGFAASLSEDERWALIDDIRANNAGQAMAASGFWPVPVQAPDFAASCSGKTVTLEDLRGHVVRLIIGSAEAMAADPDVTTIFATSVPAPTDCVVDDEMAPLAYAVVAGIAPRDLPGTAFLIDGDGWLRALQRPGAGATWHDPQALASEVQAIRAQPIKAPPPSMPTDMKM